MKRMALFVNVISVVLLSISAIPAARAGNKKIHSSQRMTAPATSDLSFAAAVNFDAGYFTSSIAAGDFNGDGKLDLAVIDCATIDCPAQQVAMLLGNGDGTFQAPVGYGTQGYTLYSLVSLIAADINGDSKLDLIVVNGCASVNPCSGSQPGVISVLLGNGDGTFQTTVTYNSGGAAPEYGVVADVNGDGKPDLVVYNALATSGGSADGVIGVLLGNGDGTFQSALSYDSGLPGPGRWP